MTEGTRQITPGAVMVRRADRSGGDRKLRPCVVVSTEERCRDTMADTLIVVPLTSSTDGRDRLPMPLVRASPANGLVHHSAAMCGRITCLRRLHLNRSIGQVHATDLRRIRLGVLAVIGLADLLLGSLKPEQLSNASFFALLSE